MPQECRETFIQNCSRKHEDRRPVVRPASSKKIILKRMLTLSAITYRPIGRVTANWFMSHGKHTLHCNAQSAAEGNN
jgi:hypothetical protein